MDSVARLTIILFFSWIVQISSESILKLPSEKEISGEYCDSWRLAVETNNVGSWNQIPANCVDSVAEYMIGERYKRDCDVVGKFSTEFAKRVAIGGDGRDAWVFDIDETLLSNVPYYQAVGFGLNLYRKLQDLGFTIFLLTGRSEHQRNATEANLLFAGYRNWERLILRGPSDQGKSATNFKSQKREELIIEGYRIHGSSGDQWSDLWGFAVASRSFKLPNPMYFIP
ncbi:unnamed protein product [Trifolium pratense]|uniref:Uncharacterized protein n=1 Tax=Trifolium pratense TaxID=57577 RepID=A0ACB0IXP0_TRIPR|nr:unnamed protein product [Trifolium pratense]